MNNEFIENDVLWGLGTLKMFTNEYKRLSSTLGQKIVASNLFPIGTKDKEGFMVYEYLIFFRNNPNTQLQFSPQGVVENTLYTQHVQQNPIPQQMMGGGLQMPIQQQPQQAKDIDDIEVD